MLKPKPPCNNPYTKNTWLITLLRTLGIGRPPTSTIELKAKLNKKYN
jgi:hypothetical protein